MVADTIAPEGLGQTLLAVTIVMTVLATVAVALRLYVRHMYNAFAVDDWLMLAGWVSRNLRPLLSRVPFSRQN